MNHAVKLDIRSNSFTKEPGFNYIYHLEFTGSG